MTETRRHALKMLGAIGVTCAFPFAGDELYGQHAHAMPGQGPSPGPYVPAFFTPTEYATIARLTDVIIPPTETPGAAAAGVPEYIDRVIALNAEHQPLIRAGLAWLERQAQAHSSREFVALGEAEQVAMLQPLSDALDQQHRQAQRARFRTGAQGRLVYHVAVTDRDPPARAATEGPAAPDSPGMPVRFFRLVKNLTADGYYTSRSGLLDELRYAGNTAMGAFPACAVPEH